MSTFNHFVFAERKIIEKYLNQGKSYRWLAARLDRSLSSVADEIKRNAVKGRYQAEKAELKAWVKRKYSKIQCLKVVMNRKLRDYVVKNILAHQSPEGISGRLKRIEHTVPYASGKAIYKFVHSPHGRQIEKHLYSRAVKKNGGPKRGRTVSIDGRVMIDERPKEIETREEFGHYEGDFIESGKEGRGSLLVLVERKTRYPFLRYTLDRSTATINQIVAELLRGLPVNSFTVDNDLSFQKHEALSEIIRAAVFFCHPQSPHEKGTVENRNKAIRRYVPKRSDLSQLTTELITEIEHKLRHRFMKCLDYRTPAEAFTTELGKIETKKATSGGMIKKLLVRECSA